MVVDGLPLVSIITPVYNGSEYLEELIQSVRSQDYPNIEHLIIDDGSKDDGATISILHRYPHVRWWSQPNKGQYATMNDGLAAARGEIICFVSADDVVSPNAVRLAVQYLLERPSMDGVFGITHYMDQDGNYQLYPIPFRLAPIRFYPYFAHISHCSLYIRKTPVLAYGLSFNPSLHLVGDYDWIIRIDKAGLRVGVIYEELARVRIHARQASQLYQDDSAMEAQTVRNAYRINGLAYLVFSTINLFLVRIGKIASMIKTLGLRGTMLHLIKRTS